MMKNARFPLRRAEVPYIVFFISLLCFQSFAKENIAESALISDVDFFRVESGKMWIVLVSDAVTLRLNTENSHRSA